MDTILPIRRLRKDGIYILYPLERMEKERKTDMIKTSLIRAKLIPVIPFRMQTKREGCCL